MKTCIALLALFSTGAFAAPLALPSLSAGGHNCGGTHPYAYISGFGAGHTITGVIHTWTSCGGSGRGGGYRTTRYESNWSVTWDFFNNYIAGAYDGTPLVNNTAVDEFGNVATAINGHPTLTVQTIPPDAIHLRVIVPPVVGKLDADAQAAVIALGLFYAPNYQYLSSDQADIYPAGTVFSQDLLAGSKVLNGSTVNAGVSLGTSPDAVVPLTVPNFVGMDANAAYDAIEAMGLVVGQGTVAVYSDAPLNSIISTNPIAGTAVEAGASVDLLVSLGPCDPTTAVCP